MRRTEIAGLRAESYETPQGMASKTACSEREIKGFAVGQGELTNALRRLSVPLRPRLKRLGT